MNANTAPRKFEAAAAAAAANPTPANVRKAACAFGVGAKGCACVPNSVSRACWAKASGGNGPVRPTNGFVPTWARKAVR